MEKQLIGHWNFGCGGYNRDGTFTVDEWDCSNCGKSNSERLDCCPYCGIKMQNVKNNKQGNTDE